jgi:hypothetical protein
MDQQRYNALKQVDFYSTKPPQKGQNVYKNQYSSPSVLHTVCYLQIKHNITLALKPSFNCVGSKAYLALAIYLCCPTYILADTEYTRSCQLSPYKLEEHIILFLCNEYSTKTQLTVKNF